MAVVAVKQSPDKKVSMVDEEFHQMAVVALKQ
jgi:uncharacterized protein (DUF934 family)